ncbi:MULTISPECIES: nitronate monooxygenase [unclassified Solwaraspora]|uniref:NAD(P)H-dependent flavin oxidoreductase n=1 Tax=unclassified Solwaraspora TaxID=2627926 RepID=UPI00248CC4FE|nr:MULTISPECIES: nitronate monooxygenase [unclassified Solwaraspora]WBB98918.1 nitronate monooxygenase [Solwaraspora sp. WMMA2059]WBC22529.1 nitronate monooxygenase [Solwaraspora sp. WMMA2080]WJK35417.1 nitronate monooxygenase [Solwaraspora sp. WMMA2065]
MTPLCRRVGIDLPVIAFSHCRDVVAAVSRGGGLGVLGAASMSPEDLEQDLAWLDRECGRTPYGVDLLFPATTAGDDPADLLAQIPAGHQEFVAGLRTRLGIPQRRSAPGRTRLGGMPTEIDHLMTHANAYALWEVVQAHPVRLVASALGPPPAAVRAVATRRDMLVAGLVGDQRHVRHQLAAGVDVIVAQGYEAAGHTGETTTMVLVPQVVAAAGEVPVVAAGGIATGRQVVAALALGAQAVWTGSIWLSTAESDLDPVVKDKIVTAAATDTAKTTSYTGKPTRQLTTAWTRAWQQPPAPAPLASPVQQLLARDAVVSSFEHQVTPVMGSAAGQAVGLVDRVRSVASVLDDLRTGMADAVGDIAALADDDASDVGDAAARDGD